MTFRISPKPMTGSGAYQQAVAMKRMLEDGGWAKVLSQHGPTAEHIPFMSYAWAIAFPHEGPTKVSFGGHEVVFEYTFKPVQKMHISVDGFPISWHIAALRIMLLDDEEVTS